MKHPLRSLLALLLACALVFGAVPSALAAGTSPEGDELTAYERFQQIMEIYLATHVNEPDKEAVYEHMIQLLLEADPELLYYLANMAMSAYDPYSHYFTPEQLDQILHTPSFVGLGVQIQNTVNGYVILEVYNGSAAKFAGLQPGDTLLRINGKEIANLPSVWVQSLLSGKDGDEIVLTYSHEGILRTARIELASVYLPSVSYETLGTTGIGYIRVTEFVESATMQDFFNALLQLSSLGVRELVIDVRDNPGGEMTTCLNMINYLTPEIGLELCTLSPRDEAQAETFYSQGTPFSFDNVKILVNEYTISAAELFAISLQKNGFAELVGVQTYGKAVAQTYYGLNDGSAAAVTTYEILAPGGLHYNGKGAAPDIQAVLAPHVYDRAALTAPSYSGYRYITEAVLGADNDVVLSLEQRLALLGYLTEADSVFDESTALALRYFQNSADLYMSGEVNLETLVALGAAVERACTEGVWEDDQLDAAVARILDERPSAGAAA